MIIVEKDNDNDNSNINKKESNVSTYEDDEQEFDVENKTHEELDIGTQKATESLDDLIKERDELRDQYIRIVADNENLRKRTDREISSAKKYASFYIVKDLLSCIDNLEKAIHSMPNEKDALDENIKNIFLGIEMTFNELDNILEKHGVEKIEPKNEKFDYNLHQAMYEIPTDEFEKGHVIEVVQKGFLLHDRLLRPAMVGVSKSSNNEKNINTEDEINKNK